VQRTALVVEVFEAESLVAELRAAHDPIAAKGMPAHVTVLYPFIHPGAMDAMVLGHLRAVVGQIESFSYALAHLGEFSDAVWLRPEPDVQFRALTTALWTAFPDYPPYEGRFPDSQPHLTVGLADSEESRAAVRSAAEKPLGPHLPLTCRCDAISVFESDSSGHWTRAEILGLR
jgi:2'-5' RNA ligase superfamily